MTESPWNAWSNGVEYAKMRKDYQQPALYRTTKAPWSTVNAHNWSEINAQTRRWQMIDRSRTQLSVVRQSVLLGANRTGLFTETEVDVVLKRLIGEILTAKSLQDADGEGGDSVESVPTQPFVTAPGHAA
jgi:hypothetical protein